MRCLRSFPTKALAQDQLRALRELCAAAFGDAAPRVAVFDGDTAMADRWRRCTALQWGCLLPGLLPSLLPSQPCAG